ncbi:GNAT family N-acetyltransferase [Vibrio mangrovi]|uniref:GNAT family N-acetyltransferase n=1 Tax=Vibrio mangrovi TaxID=474394 RepID=A0A1Y6IXC6_9VIBR|nr:GNAT family N-acetyltransferase [Vibrio mangrovi]MDW6004909.1 GNAT family N-acetyltransferase [Vibrio mangrovi]SMS01671.1 putative acetyltransferase [Vibrio mangrovi]
MIIRKAEATDVDGLLTLNYQIGKLHFENVPQAFVEPSDADRNFLLEALRDETRLFLLAEIEDKVVGFITAIITKNETVPFLVTCPICRIGTIVVDENCRASGIGSELMSVCTDWAKTQGAEQMRLEVMSFNETAQRFYDKLGFENQSLIMFKAIDTHE